MIIPGILELDFEKAKEKYARVESFAPIVQIDIADGFLVDGTTFTEVSKLIELEGAAQIQLHFMVQKPETLITFIPGNVRDVCTQVEAYANRPDLFQGYIDILKTRQFRIGLSFNPQTAWEEYTDYIKQLDYIQFMTVHPGGQGRSFQSSVLEKIRNFRKAYPDFYIQVDGGIDSETLPQAVSAGANAVCIGSHFFKTDNLEKTYQDFMLEFDHARELI